jgi:hypothetical protein
LTPDDVSTVQRSWAELRRERAAILAGLTRRFEAVAASPTAAAGRAVWLVSAVEDLVGLLSAPSRLAACARDLGETWPDPLKAPSFAVEGVAWMRAADDCLATWTERTEAAWRQAWLLLSEVLAAETLSPFSDRAEPDQAHGVA